jgi:tetratricopeptide (TPR) repeat protein
VGHWKSEHKAKCKLLKKASETIDELFALKRPLVKEQELDRLAKAYETFVSANACTHRHFYKALVVVWRVSGRPSRAAQGHKGYLETEESAMSMAEACQMFMTLHAKRIGIQDDENSDLAEGKSDEVKGRGRMKARMERQANAELRGKIAAENEEIRKAVAGLALSRPETLPAESCTHDHAQGGVCTGAYGTHGEGESEAWRGERDAEAQIMRRIKAYDKLVRLFESRRWEEVIDYVEEQLHHLHRQAREASGRKQELRKSLEIAVYFSSLGYAYVKVDKENRLRGALTYQVRPVVKSVSIPRFLKLKFACGHRNDLCLINALAQGLELLEESIKLLGQTDLPAEPFYPLSLSGTRFNKPGGLPESIVQWHVEPYCKLGKFLLRHGSYDEALAHLEKAEKIMAEKKRTTRHLRTNLAYAIAGFKLQGEIVKAVMTQVRYAHG